MKNNKLKVIIKIVIKNLFIKIKLKYFYLNKNSNKS